MDFNGIRRLILALATPFPWAVLAQQDTTALAGQLTEPAQKDTISVACHSTDTASTYPINTADRAAAFISSSFYGSLSASYAASQNWGGRDLKNYAFMGNLLYRHSLFAGTRSHMHQLMADVGYLKFVDSVWVKNIDRLQTNFLWSSTGKRFNRSYTIAFGTQFLPYTFAAYDVEQNKLVERSVGGFLNPFTLDAGYGAVFTFWNTSNLNFAFATLRLNGSPKELTPVTFAESNTLESRNAYYFLTYGFSVSAAINKSFGQHVQWVNNTRFFGNGLDRDHVNVDFSNMVIIKLWKYLQLRMDTRVAYNPLLNYNIQFRQEVLIGFFYERNN